MIDIPFSSTKKFSALAPNAEFFEVYLREEPDTFDLSSVEVRKKTGDVTATTDSTSQGFFMFPNQDVVEPAALAALLTA